MQNGGCGVVGDLGVKTEDGLVFFRDVDDQRLNCRCALYPGRFASCW